MAHFAVLMESKSGRQHQKRQRVSVFHRLFEFAKVGKPWRIRSRFHHYALEASGRLRQILGCKFDIRSAMARDFHPPKSFSSSQDVPPGDAMKPNCA
jgi:hypothetical protein